MLPTSSTQKDYDGWSDSSSVSDTHSNNSPKSPGDEDAVERLVLKPLLYQFLHRWGAERITPPISSENGLFRNLGQLICSGPEMSEWLTSKDNDFCLLRLPQALHNRLVVASVTAALKENVSGLNIASAQSGPDLVSDCSFEEYMLASLCAQWCEKCATDYLHLEVLEEMNVSFKGYSPGQRKKSLRQLFDVMTTDEDISKLAVVLDLPQQTHGVQGLQTYLDALGWMEEHTKSMDHPIKILIILNTHQKASWGAKHTVAVDLDDKKIQESLVADLMSFIDSSVVTLPLLSRNSRAADVKEGMLPIIHKHISQPMRVFSYIHNLKTRPWASRAQLRADSAAGLLSHSNISSGALFSLVLESIRPRDRSVVADLLGFLDVCGRPMRLAELEAALCVNRLLPKGSDQLNDWKLFDLRHDIIYSLAGLVIVQDNEIRLLNPFWDNANKSDGNNSLASADLPWLQSRLDSHKLLAMACLRYISLCSNSQAIIDGESYTEQWPFLQYAITFWYHHYTEAYRNNSGDDDEVKRILVENPHILRSWLMYQDAVGHAGLPIKKKQSTKSSAGPLPSTVTSDLYPDILASKFCVTFAEGVQIASRAYRITPVMRGDMTTASIWSAWLSHQNQIFAGSSGAPLPSPTSKSDSSSWLKDAGSMPDSESLLRALRYAVEPTFQLLSLSDSSFVRINAKEILKISISQGVSSVAKKCVDILADVLDTPFLSSLPIKFCFRLGSESIWKKLEPYWRTPDDAPKQDTLQVPPELEFMYLTIRYAHWDTLDWLLTWLRGYVQDALPVNDVLESMAGCGRPKYMSLVLQKFPDWVKKTSNEDLRYAVRCACKYGRMEAFSVLVAQDGFSRKHEDEMNTFLYFAVQSGDLKSVKRLVDPEEETDTNRELAAESKACILAVNNSDTTPLSEAVANGSEDITALLLDCLPQGTDLTPGFLLHAAAGKGKLGTLKQILEIEGLDVNQQNSDGLTPLHMGCRSGNPDVIQELMENGADAWIVDTYGDAPLWELIHHSQEQTETTAKIVNTFVEMAPPAETMGKLLGDAAALSCDWVVAKLLDVGADKNFQNVAGRSALHHAAYNGHESTVCLLLQRQVAIDLTDSYGDTPIKDAATKQHTGIVGLLLDAGASAETDGGDGTQNLAYVAANQGDDETLKLLQKRGIRLPLSGPGCPLVELSSNRRYSTMRLILEHQPEFEGLPVLHECAHAALRNSDVQMLTLLLQNGADPSVVSAKHLHGSALHECALYSNTKMARMLLDLPKPHGNVNLEVGQYHTPLIAAVSRAYSSNSPSHPKVARRLQRQADMIAFLMQKGAKIDVRGGRLGSMLHAAAAMGSPDLIKLVCDLGLSIKLCDVEDRNAAHLACSRTSFAREKLEMIDNLSKSEADQSSDRISPLFRDADRHGRRPLHFASGNTVIEAIRFILEDADVAKEEINCQDKDGWTPLHWACRQWDVMVLGALVSAGADRTARTAKPMDDSSDDDALWTPWDVAVFYSNANDSFAEMLSVTDQTTDIKLGFGHNATCDSCFVNVVGVRHTCETCGYYDLCNKCVRWATELHEPWHSFKKQTDDSRLAEPAPSASHESSDVDDSGEDNDNSS